ncbi:MAG: hypothetical protein ACQETE_03305 [Bacteroidota bacterium]
MPSGKFAQRRTLSSTIEQSAFKATLLIPHTRAGMPVLRGLNICFGCESS